MNKKVLIIDDDARNIFALKAVLKAKKFSCLSAVSAEEGLAVMRSSNDVGIVLMDMMMPDMDGYEAIRLIKSDLVLEKIPVIAVTAQAMVGDREKCLAAGANDYVSKPINIDALLTCIDKYINKN